MTIYGTPEQADLSSFGRSTPGWIIDSLFQEVDLATGKLLLEWKAADHYNISDTLAPIRNHGYTKDDPFDYFHINSIDKDPLGNYYFSSRYMHTITCISPSGRILWKLGGPHSSFTDLSGGAASNFSWQHHMRWHPGNLISIFDNGAFNALATADHSRALLIQLNITAMTAELIHVYTKLGVRAHSQGSVQLLPGLGNVFIGWGHTPAYTEFAANGSILCDVHFGPSAFWNLGWAKSYRAVKAGWVGSPRTKPVVMVGEGGKRVFVSWNGATEVVGWILEAGLRVGEENEERWEVLGQVKKEGFETSIEIEKEWPGQGTWFRVAAVGSDGEVLGISNVVMSRGRSGGSGMASLFVVVCIVLAALSMVFRRARIRWTRCESEQVLSLLRHDEECACKHGRAD